MEDYEKKYKDALAIVKSYYGRTQFSSVHDTKEEIKTLESAFPELKDVKSERVKEDIKYILANTDLSKVPSSFSDMLEWVDNREGKAELLDGEDYGIDGLYHAIRILEKTLGEVEGYQSDDGILDHEIAIDTVKELYSKRPKWSDEDADNLEEIIMFCDTLAGGEMYKLTNEKLKSISKTLKSIKKGTVSPTNQKLSEEDISRSWTIQDAKDGDVLATLDHILIFEKLLPKDGGVSYCHYDFGCLIPQFNFNKDDNWYFGKEAKVYPATKEQRDLLFQKMKEAGYEWDTEKKELTKIVDKSSWSEDDEKFFKTALWHISYSISNGKSTDIHCDTTDWFKSLKDRVQPQPKQEWSEEDEKTIHLACEFIRHRSESNGSIGGINYSELINRLRSIIPQNRWKPTEKEMKALGIAIRSGIQLGTWEEDALKSLAEQLKNLSVLYD